VAVAVGAAVAVAVGAAVAVAGATVGLVVAGGVGEAAAPAEQAATKKVSSRNAAGNAEWRRLRVFMCVSPDRV
jgi:hypothetical protein